MSNLHESIVQLEILYKIGCVYATLNKAEKAAIDFVATNGRVPLIFNPWLTSSGVSERNKLLIGVHKKFMNIATTLEQNAVLLYHRGMIERYGFSTLEIRFGPFKLIPFLITRAGYVWLPNTETEIRALKENLATKEADGTMPQLDALTNMWYYVVRV